MRIFEKDGNGKLFEITAKQAAGRRFTACHEPFVVVFTQAEEAARDAEEKELAAKLAAEAEAARALDAQVAATAEEFQRMRERLAVLEGAAPKA